MRFTVDASVAVKWFVPEPGFKVAAALLTPDAVICAPEFLFVEVANVLWKKVRKGDFAVSVASAACGDLPGYLSEVAPSPDLMERALELALLMDHPAYDCFYVACAEVAAAPLVTDDQRLLKAAAQAGLARHVTPLHA